MLIKRREFLKVNALASASFMLPRFLKAMNLPGALENHSKVLVVLQLSGGNDGLIQWPESAPYLRNLHPEQKCRAVNPGST